MEKFYQDVQQGINYAKSNEVICVMGDLNAKVGSNPYTDTVGKFGLGKINERGERLIQFCEQNQLVITNTCFQQSKRKTYTWKSPGDKTRNQIDYIMVNKRFRNSVKQAKTYPGADINSDHNPVVIKMKIKLKRIKKPQKVEQQDLNLLKQEQYKDKYNIKVRNQYDTLCSEETEQLPIEASQETIQQKWTNVKTCLQTSIKAVLPKKEKKKTKVWMTDQILQKMEVRKTYKSTNDERYRETNREITRDCRIAKEAWLNEQCQEIEKLEKHYKSREMHKKVKELSLKKKSEAVGCIKDKNGNVLFGQEEIADRWVEYIKELYDDDREPMPQCAAIRGESILKEEVEKAINSMKNGKAVGPDNISTEALKALDQWFSNCFRLPPPSTILNCPNAPLPNPLPMSYRS